jgi:hypothetical protein
MLDSMIRFVLQVQMLISIPFGARSSTFMRQIFSGWILDVLFSVCFLLDDLKQELKKTAEEPCASLRVNAFGTIPR